MASPIAKTSRIEGGSQSGYRPAHPFDDYWYVNVSDKTYGPYSGHELRQMISQKRIEAVDFVYPVKGSRWVQVKDDPILAILFQQKRPQRKKHRTRNITIGVGVVLITALLWIIWPYYALYELSNALQDGDSVALDGMVEWSSVREGLRGDLNVLFLSQMKSQKNDIGNGLAALLMPSVINQMVDSYVTPQGIAYLIRTGKPKVPPAEQAQNGGTSVATERFSSRPISRPLNDRGASGPESSGLADDDKGQAVNDPSKRFGIDQIRYAFFSGSPFAFKVEVIPKQAQTKEPLVLLFKWAGYWG